jgi:thioredoxin reductase (NADPH)
MSESGKSANSNIPGLRAAEAGAPETVRPVDCAIVGGGPAGLSAAVCLARMRRSVLVIDDRDGRSLWSQTNRNYLGFPDGIPATELRLQGRRQAARYGTSFLLGRVTAADRDGGLFHLLVDGDAGGGAGLDGAGTDANVARDEELGRSLGEVRAGHSEQVVARTVILATGVRDPFPRFPGRDECVGRSLFWCISCDGYEAIGCSVGVVGHNEEAVEMALDLLEFTPRVTIAAGRAGGFSVPEKRLADLGANGIAAYGWSVASYPNENGQIQALVLGDPKKTRIPVEMVFAWHTPTARNEIARQLGVELNEVGQIVVDSEAHTNVPGLYAAGDATSLHDHQVSAAVHEGNQAACAANYYLYRPVQRAPGQEEC